MGPFDPKKVACIEHQLAGTFAFLSVPYGQPLVNKKCPRVRIRSTISNTCSRRPFCLQMIYTFDIPVSSEREHRVLIVHAPTKNFTSASCAGKAIGFLLWCVSQLRSNIAQIALIMSNVPLMRPIVQALECFFEHMQQVLRKFAFM